MARVVVFLDLFGLPVISGAVGLLEGRQFAPGDALGSPAVLGGAVAIPSGDTARQNALNCASVKVCEGLRSKPNFLSLLRL